MTTRSITRTDSEIDDVLNQAIEAFESGESKYPGMTYEDGIRAFADWVFGDTNDHPFED